MTTLNVRIEEKTKKAAQKTLANMGLDMSTAVNLFLRQVIRENGLPFTPMTDAKAKKIRERWDKEAAWAMKHGKRYNSVQELMQDLHKEDA